MLFQLCTVFSLVPPCVGSSSLPFCLSLCIDDWAIIAPQRGHLTLGRCVLLLWVLIWNSSSYGSLLLLSFPPCVPRFTAVKGELRGSPAYGLFRQDRCGVWKPWRQLCKAQLSLRCCLKKEKKQQKKTFIAQHKECRSSAHLWRSLQFHLFQEEVIYCF